MGQLEELYKLSQNKKLMVLQIYIFYILSQGKMHFPTFKDALRLSNPNGTLNPQWKNLSMPTLICNNASQEHQKLWPFAICDAVCTFGSSVAIEEMLSSKIFEEVSKVLMENLDSYSHLFPNLLSVIYLRGRLPDDIVIHTIKMDCSVEEDNSVNEVFFTFPVNNGTPLFVCDSRNLFSLNVRCLYQAPLLYKSYLNAGNPIAIQQFAKLFANSKNPTDPLLVINGTKTLDDYCSYMFKHMNELCLKASEVELELAFLRKYLEQTSPDTLVNFLVPDLLIIRTLICNCKTTGMYLKQYNDEVAFAERTSASAEEFEHKEWKIMKKYKGKISSSGQVSLCPRHTAVLSRLVLWFSNDDIVLSDVIKQRIIQNPYAKRNLDVMIKQVKSYHTPRNFVANSTIELWRDLKKNCVRPKTRRVVIPLSYFMFRSDYVHNSIDEEDEYEREEDGEDFI